MAFFNNDTFTSMIPTFESSRYDLDNGGLVTFVEECNQDQLAIIQAIHAADIAELKVKAKYRSVYEAAGDADDDTDEIEDEELKDVQEKSVKDIFASIKDFFAKLWGRITAFFKNLFEKLFVFSKSNKSFVETYKPKIEELDSAKAELEGFNYATDIVKMLTDASEKAKGLQEFYQSVFDKINWDSYTEPEDFDDTTKDAVFQKLLGIKNPSTTSAASATLIACRNGDTKTKVSYDKSKILAELNEIKEFNPNDFKKAEANIKKGYDKIIAGVNKAEKAYAKTAAGKGDDAASAAAIVTTTRKFSSRISIVKSTSLTIISAFRTAAVEKAEQTKRATIAALGNAKSAAKAANKNNK